MSSNLYRVWLWGLTGVVAILLLMGLAWVAGRLFDPNSEDRQRYETCLAYGGSYSSNGSDASYKCEDPEQPVTP